MSVTSFKNQDWDIAKDAAWREFPSLNTQISLYQSTEFEPYVLWLKNTASSFVKASEPELTSNKLANF